MATDKKTGLVLKSIDKEAEDSLFKKPRPIYKNSLKRVVSNDEDEIDQHEGRILKKKRVEIDEEQSRAYRQEATTTLTVPSEANKQIENKILENLEDIQVSLEKDYNAMKDNEQVLDQLAICAKQNIQQICSLLKQKIQDINGIRKSFIEEVEGLLTRGAMKPDDRPLWFDVYKAFPPIVDPKFAQPKPEIKPIRQILYQEDITRAKFHSNGHGLGTINMLNPNSETQIKRLLQQYDTLKSEGVAEEELIEKSVAAVEIDRQLEAPKQKITAKEPESATAQVLAEANLKNIFKE